MPPYGYRCLQETIALKVYGLKFLKKEPIKLILQSENVCLIKVFFEILIVEIHVENRIEYPFGIAPVMIVKEILNALPVHVIHFTSV